MKAIAVTSTFLASALGEADAVVQKLAQIHVGIDGKQKLAVTVA